MRAAWWVTTHPVGDALVVTTAPTQRQVSAILWGELRRLHSRLGLPGSIGLVVERRRLAHEDDGLIWYCQRCNHKLYEEYFHLHDIEQDLPPVFDRFYRSTEHRSCRHCGHLHPRPDRYDAAPGSLADIT